MPPDGLFDDSADDTRTAIMEATYQALVEYGYADLTIQRIADEFGKSKSLLYHHHDGKDDLLVDFLEFILDHLEEGMTLCEGTRADERLRSFVGALAVPEDAESEEFAGIVVELRAQAVNDPDYRDHFTRSNRFFRDYIADIVRDGIEEGTFREVDPDRTASFLLTVANGAMGEYVATDRPDAARAVLDELDAYVEERMLKEE
ncbi:TetR/AcrR family transcriptional regulator [Halorussus gelatinilyticus]|uniref:TetR/AcrR family transcriptional regulator n=1 Tax=Halorussus gelatinilyticus TaxID=2937524 RepID=A0A8U0IM41_9EURY|nr:TetR family transcriptional regulator C-terminal domain-containing protein [Halorussus gelatinilyticus]UPW02200.1 TetR/AcrR family transcriptional regulator [Halorussus gelatinilyticus]